MEFNQWKTLFPEHCAHSPKALSPFTTFCLLWSYLCATSEPKALWSWISSYNPSQKLNGLWHPAGLCSPINLRPQFPELRFDVWSSLSASPTRPVDIESFFASIFSTCDHISLLKIDLFDPPLCVGTKIIGAGRWRGREAAKWLTDELPFLGRSSLKPRCAIPTSARASLYDLRSLGPSTANPT